MLQLQVILLGKQKPKQIGPSLRQAMSRSFASPPSEQPGGMTGEGDRYHQAINSNCAFLLFKQTHLNSFSPTRPCAGYALMKMGGW